MAAICTPGTIQNFPDYKEGNYLTYIKSRKSKLLSPELKIKAPAPAHQS